MVRITTPCPVCSEPVSTTASVRRRGNGLYCSKRCFTARHALPVIVDGAIARVPLCSQDGSIRAYALIDAVDAKWVGQWRWHLSTDGYAHRNGDGKESIPLHREVLGLPRVFDGREGDHKNHDRLNCCRDNLRIVSHVGNQQNAPSRKGASSRYRGVSWNTSRGKWRATVNTVCSGGKQHHLGYFDSELEAANVAREGRARLMAHALD